MKNKNLATVYIVRHGETEWNTKGLIQGHLDSPLTKKGVNQAKEIAKKLKKIKFDLVFSSDLLRAKETANIIVREDKLTVNTTKLLRERAFGEFEGKPHADTMKIYEETLKFLNTNDRFKHKPGHNIESDEEVTTRFITFLRETTVAYPQKNILVVTHGGIIRAFLIHAGYATYEDFAFMDIENGSYIKLLTNGVDFFVNETKGIKNLKKLND